jgi:hypothetical protein
MGYYINPTDKRTKEQWLEDEGQEITRVQVLSTFDTETHIPVCLVHNTVFTTAAILHNVQTAKAFLRYDGRLKYWYKVKREKLRSFCYLF